MRHPIGTPCQGASIGDNPFLNAADFIAFSFDMLSVKIRVAIFWALCRYRVSRTKFIEELNEFQPEELQLWAN